MAPPAIGTTRIETTQPVGTNGNVSFDNQSDDVPQPIEPRFYPWRTGVLVSQIYPHPVMCGPNGPIRVFPDHMHEGEVIVPPDLGATFDFAGTHVVEYPAGRHGVPVAPEIVAWGEVVAETNTASENTHTGDPNDVAVKRRFGVVGAYDGHVAKVGRVVVDSTWHHFFDINLIGDPVAPFPKTEGFLASASGQAALADIRAYYRNIGIWIAHPGRLWTVYVGGAWAALRAQPLNMIVHPERRFTVAEVDQLGSLAWQCLLRFAPPCTVLQVHWSVIVQQVGPQIPHVWGPNPPDPGPLDRGPWLVPEDVARVMLGHTVVALGAARREIERAGDAEAGAHVAEAAARDGVRDGLHAAADRFGTQAESLERFARTLRGQPRRQTEPRDR